MLNRRTFVVWIGIACLSGMFLLGQEPWGPTCVDDDGDGYGYPGSTVCTHPEVDCNDTNADVYPGAPEICDGIDNQCSGDVGYGEVDEGGVCVQVSGLIPDTGISECYDNSTVIPCPAPDQPFYGQDAQYVTNPMSYTVSPDGLTVTDNVTGLMWQRCSAGLSGAGCSAGSASAMAWANAVSYCDGLSLAGHTDWRLPNELELQSIVHYDLYDPAIDIVIYPNTVYTWDDYYWSASTYAAQTSEAWYIYYDDGGVRKDEKSNAAYVRCVRGESVARSFTNHGDGTVTDNVTGLMWQQQDDGILRNWESALAYCEGLSLGEHSDWRLPDIKMLRSIVDNMRYEPAIDTTVFPDTRSYCYLSSSTYASYTSAVWGVGFKGGRVESCPKMYTGEDLTYVRCVR